MAIDNAGIGQSLAPLTGTSVKKYARIMVFLGMKYRLADMIALGRGAILNVASAAGPIKSANIALQEKLEAFAQLVSDLRSQP